MIIYVLWPMVRYILHADDDSGDRWDLKYIITSLDSDIVVRGFDNGLELIQHLAEVPDHQLPGLIFLDLRMPIWDGIRTLKALQSETRYSGIPVYIWSTADSKSEMDLCLRLGAHEFITKPVNDEDWNNVRDILADHMKKMTG